tara:strand:+ start:2718 stop:3560 length:843 start_codon:yes stop_codon:yes gene_type:complete
LFATEGFIEASRKFVCVRLESFESKEHQDMVREFLNGKFENTAFCILKPDGKTRLSGTGRSPQMAFRTGGRSQSNDPNQEENNKKTIAEMDKISAKYTSKASDAGAVVQDFHTFKQALNIASGDQRLLVFTVAAQKDRAVLKKLMQKVANHPDAIGRYHYDFADTVDAEWSKAIKDDKNKTGIFIIRAGEFGQDGQTVAELPLNSNANKVLDVLEKVNKDFATSEKRKVYSDHVEKGRKEGIKYEDNMPWGEDRDADGKIDERPSHRGGRGDRRGPPPGR